MAITYNITEDGLYKKGLEQGIQSSKQQMILKALQLGLLTVEQIAEIAEVDLSYVLRVRDSKLRV